MMQKGQQHNPYPGLRPFNSDEADLFFGREANTQDLLRRLRRNRFLAIVGTSGSGKSSLVRAGMIPALLNDRTQSESRWRVAIFRPGNRPLRALAASINAKDVLGPEKDEERDLRITFTETTLRRGTRGLIEVVRQARNLQKDRLLVIVDQFEQLFRFKEYSQNAQASDEAAAFVNLLLEASRDRSGPVYVVMTMRSDFLGECSQFRDLPEAINDGQYLIPRMTRDQRQMAIEGPAEVRSVTMSHRLVQRLLNEVGDNPDQLPILQHALMRTWDYWEAHDRDSGIIDLTHYENVGGIEKALFRHAEEAFSELTEDVSEETGQRRQYLAEKLFRAITEKEPDNREIRRPTTLGELCSVIGADTSELIPIIEVFRQEGRSFLMPPVGTPLRKDSLIDISHESLIRVWNRLKKWVDTESLSAHMYRRLAETAVLHEKDEAGLWSDPDLQLALAWQERENPTPSWAARYHPAFEQAMQFLKKSRTARNKKFWSRIGLVGFVIAVAFTALIGYASQQARYALLMEELAQNAERERVIADSLRIQADSSASRALRAQREAVEEKQRAESLRLQAERSAAQARRAEREASESAELATLQSQRALSRALAAQSLTHLENRLDQALLLSTEANNIFHTDESFSSLLTALQHNPPLQKYVRGHTAAVNDVTFSPDGTILASASSDNTIRLWSAQTGQAVGDPLSGHNAPVNSLVYSPDGRFLYSAGEDFSVRRWPVQSDFFYGEPLYRHREAVTSLAISPDSSVLASGSHDQTIRLWSIQSGELLHILEGHTAAVFDVVFSPDGQRLASAAEDRTIRLWSVGTGQPVGAPLEGHTSSVSSIAFSPDGSMLASGSFDNTLRLWSLESGRQLDEPLQGHTGFVRSIAFSPDGQYLASASQDQTIRLWSVQTGRVLETLRGHTSFVYSVAFSPDGQTIASASDDQRVLLWSVREEREFNSESRSPRLHTSLIHNVVFSPDGQYLATASDDNTIRLWSVREDFSLRPEGDPLKGHTAAVRSVAFSPDGALLASASSDNTVRLWSVVTGQPFGEPLQGHTGTVNSVDFSPDGQLLASASNDRSVRIWSVQTGQPLDYPFYGHDSFVFSVAFSPDGRHLASAGVGTVLLWSLETDEPMGTSLDGHRNFVTDVAFSPNGQYLASSGVDRTIRIWSVETGQQLGNPLEGHTNSVQGIAFSSDNQMLASASSDRTIRLWSVKTGQLLGNPLQGRGSIYSISFSPDGRHLASAGTDRFIHLWDVHVPSWQNQACRIANRNLSASEWNQYIGTETSYELTCPDLPPGD